MVLPVPFKAFQLKILIPLEHSLKVSRTKASASGAVQSSPVLKAGSIQLECNYIPLPDKVKQAK